MPDGPARPFRDDDVELAVAGGRAVVRFASVFMQKDVIDDNIIKHGLLPLLLWTRLIQPDSLHGYWKLVLQAAFEAKAGGGEGGRGAAAPAVCLQVRWPLLAAAVACDQRTRSRQQG